MGVGAAGLVTVGLGVILTLDHASEQSRLENTFPRACRADPNSPLCTPMEKIEVKATNQKIQDNKASAAVLLPVVYGIGGALLVGGALIFLTAPSGSGESTPSAPATTVRMRLVPQVGVRDRPSRSSARSSQAEHAPSRRRPAPLSARQRSGRSGPRASARKEAERDVLMYVAASRRRERAAIGPLRPER